MGNQTAYLNYNSPFNYTSNINEQIEKDENILHPMLGHIQLWRFMKWSHPEIFSRIQYYSVHHSTLLEEHHIRSSLNHNNLLRYYGCTLSTASNIDSVFRQQQFYEYIPTTLHNLFKQNRIFYELDIWNFLDQLSSVCAYIYSNGRYHGRINENSVFVLNDKTFKLIDQYQDLSNKDCEKQDIQNLGKLVLKMMSKNNSNQSVQLVRSLAEQRQYSLQLLQLIGKIVHGDILEFNQITQLVNDRKQIPIILKEQHYSKSYTTTTKQVSARCTRERPQSLLLMSSPIYSTQQSNQTNYSSNSQRTINILNYSSNPVVPLRRVMSPPPPSSVKSVAQPKVQDSPTTQAASNLSYKSKVNP